MPKKFQEPQTSLAEVGNDVSSWSCMPACGLQELRQTRRLHWEVAWVVAFGRTCAEWLGMFLVGCSRHWICITRLGEVTLLNLCVQEVPRLAPSPLEECACGRRCALLELRWQACDLGFRRRVLRLHGIAPCWLGPQTAASLVCRFGLRSEPGRCTGRG